MTYGWALSPRAGLFAAFGSAVLVGGVSCDGGAPAKPVHYADDGPIVVMVDASGSMSPMVDSDAGDDVVDATMGFDTTMGDDGPIEIPEASGGFDVGPADVFTAPPCVSDAGLAIDTQTDPHNCATCGHDCEGGVCTAGKCAPMPVDVLVSGQPSPAGIAVDDTNVYWVNRLGSTTNGTSTSGEIMKCAKIGCGNAPSVLASGPWSGLSKLVVDAKNVYWIATGAVYSCPIEGCNGQPTTIWAGGGVMFDIAINPSTVFFTNVSTEEVLGCGLGDCDGGATIFWSMPSALPRAIAASASNLYLGLSNGQLDECTLGSCSTTWEALLPGQAEPNQMVLSGASVYFLSTGFGGGSGQIIKCDTAGCLNGGSLLVSGLSTPTGLAVDGSNVYFTDQGDLSTNAQGAGRVAKCPISGCSGAPTPIAGYVTSPQGIALDDAGVYWTDFGSTSSALTTDDGRVMVRPK